MWAPGSQGRCSPWPRSAAGGIPTGTGWETLPRQEACGTPAAAPITAGCWGLPQLYPLGNGDGRAPTCLCHDAAARAMPALALPSCLLCWTRASGTGMPCARGFRCLGAATSASAHAGCLKVEPGEGILVKLLIGGAGLAGIWSKAVLGKGCGVGGGYSPLYGIFKVRQWQTLRDPCKRDPCEHGGEDNRSIP